MFVNLAPVKYYGSSFDRRQAVRNNPRIQKFLTIQLWILQQSSVGKAYACLPPPFSRLRSVSAAATPALATPLHSLSVGGSSPSATKKSGIFGEKERSGERTFSPKMAYLVFVPPPLHKNMICKKVLYITRSYVAFFIPPPLATGNAP